MVRWLGRQSALQLMKLHATKKKTFNEHIFENIRFTCASLLCTTVLAARIISPLRSFSVHGSAIRCRVHANQLRHRLGSTCSHPREYGSANTAFHLAR